MRRRTLSHQSTVTPYSEQQRASCSQPSPLVPPVAPSLRGGGPLEPEVQNQLTYSGEMTLYCSNGPQTIRFSGIGTGHKIISPSFALPSLHLISATKPAPQAAPASSGPVVVPFLIEHDDGTTQSGDATYDAAGELMESMVVRGSGSQPILVITNEWVHENDWVLDQQFQQHFSESGDLLLEGVVRRGFYEPTSSGPGQVGVMSDAPDCSLEARAAVDAAIAFMFSFLGSAGSTAKAIATGGFWVPLAISSWGGTYATYRSMNTSVAVLDKCRNGGGGDDGGPPEREAT